VCACMLAYEGFRLQAILMLFASRYLNFQHSCNTRGTCSLGCYVMFRGDTCEKRINIWRTELHVIYDTSGKDSI
jgi:hypothetical protein